MMLRAIRIAIPLILLVGCIPVEDLGDYWDKGVVDEQLEGDWKKEGVEHALENQYLSFRADGKKHVLTSQQAAENLSGMAPTPVHCKTLLIGRHKYLMFDGRQWQQTVDKAAWDSVKEKRKKDTASAARNGGLQIYRIEGDVLVFYQADETKLREAIRQDASLGKVPDEKVRGGMASLGKMDASIVRFLGKVAEDKGFWGKTQRYKRISNLAEDLRRSRHYAPANPDSATVIVDQPDLAYFCDGNTEVLRRHLQASPEWRVFLEGGQVVCHRRALKGGFWTGARDGFEASKVAPFHALINAKENRPHREPNELENAYVIRYLFRFSKDAGIPHPMLATPKHHNEAGPTAGEIRLNMKSGNQGIQSVLAVGQKDLWFEFFEQTTLEPRARTRAALDWLRGYLETLRKSEEDVKTRGYAEALIPEGCVRSGNPTMTVERGHWANHFYIKAFVNPGRQGYVFLKARKSGSAEHIEDRYFRGGPKEYMGWSDDPSVLFYFNTDANIQASVLEETSAIEFELWFRPSDGLPSREWFKSEILPSDRKLAEIREQIQKEPTN